MIKRIAQKGVLAAFGFVFLYFLLSVGYTANPSPQDKSIAQNNREASVLFAKNCATCHGKDGRSKTVKGKLKHARDLTDARWQMDATDERIFNSIENGRGKMPAFKRKLTNEQIESLVAYVRGLKR